MWAAAHLRGRLPWSWGRFSSAQWCGVVGRRGCGVVWVQHIDNTGVCAGSILCCRPTCGPRLITKRRYARYPTRATGATVRPYCVAVPTVLCDEVAGGRARAQCVWFAALGRCHWYHQRYFYYFY